MTPERAQKPPISLPNKVLGWRSLPTVVIVIRPHLEKAFYIVTVGFCFCKSCMSQSIFFAFLTSLYKALNEFWMSFYFFIAIFQTSFYSLSFCLPTKMLQWRSRSNKGGSSCSLSCWWSRQPSRCGSNSPKFFFYIYLSSVILKGN